MFKKKNKCRLCEGKMNGSDAVMRLDTADGPIEIPICEECAEFFDKSAEVLINSRKKDEQQSL